MEQVSLKWWLSCVEWFLLCQSLGCFYLASHVNESGWQLSDEIRHKEFPDQVYPPVIPLISSKDKLK